MIKESVETRQPTPPARTRIPSPDPRYEPSCIETAEFLEHQHSIGNDLSTPRPEWHFPGLHPGDRWCVVAVRWLHSHQEGFAAPVLLAATHERSLETVPLEVLRLYAADVPDDPSSLL